MDALGRHIIIDMWGCCKDIIGDVDLVRNILTHAAMTAKANLVDIVCHQFSPYGVTGVAILAESHISVHTWPEHEYAAADIFLCGKIINLQEAVLFISKAFMARKTSTLQLERGKCLPERLPGGIPEVCVNVADCPSQAQDKDG